MTQRPQIKPLFAKQPPNRIPRIGKRITNSSRGCPRRTDSVRRSRERRVGLQGSGTGGEQDGVKKSFLALVTGRSTAGDRHVSQFFPEVNRHDGPFGGSRISERNGGPAGSIRSCYVAASG